MIAQLKRMFHSTVFRLSIVAAALFVASSFVVLGYIYYATVTTQLSAIDQDITVELADFQTAFDAGGPNAVNQVVVLKIIDPSQRSFYFYQNLNDAPTTNLESQPLPDKPRGPNETITFNSEIRDRATGKGTGVFHRARGQYQVLAPASVIFVARDTEFIMSASERLRRALMIAMGIALALGLASGVYVSRSFTRRIDSFNKLATDIRAGDFSRRAPVTGSGDELDDLADHLNGMLDHIDRLMSAMRYAGDSIAHDLRSPLTRLRTTLEATAVQVKDPQAVDALHRAADNASELLQTFESVLRIARLEAGDRRELLIDLDPKPLMDDLAELYEPSCEDAGLSLSWNIESGTHIAADRGLLSQAVSNLLENAIKYTPRGGEINLGLIKNRDGRVEISVTDTGIGIPQEQRQRVKERFVRLEQSRSKAGSGLGLSLVQAIADLHRATFALGDGAIMDKNNNTAGLRAALIFPRKRR
ncbi:MAG: HAMP domain-containing sensor histidine kinase [Robiginitomaculum sp.]